MDTLAYNEVVNLFLSYYPQIEKIVFIDNILKDYDIIISLILYPDGDIMYLPKLMDASFEEALAIPKVWQIMRDDKIRLSEQSKEYKDSIISWELSNINYSAERENNVIDQVFTKVDIPAEFPEGEDKLIEYILQNIQYPELAKENDIEGRVIVKFIVEKDGSLRNPSIYRGIEEDLDNEAIRLVMSMPKWKPAKVKGEVVRSYFLLPVKFTLP